MALDPIPAEIFDTPQAIRLTCAQTRQAAQKAALAMQRRGVRRVFFIGNGTSLYSSMAAGYTARRLATPALAGGAREAGDPFVLAWPAGDFRHFTPALDEHDVVVGVSASGEFRDVLAVFEALRGRCLRVGITHVPGSTITQLGDLTLVSAGGPSEMAVMTKTYASTLTAEHLLLLELFGAPAELFDDLEASADRCAQALSHADRLISELAPEIARFEHGFYFGAGPAFPASLETALKMKEMALLHSEGAETWEMASGPATRVGPDTFCVALYSGDQGGDEATATGAISARQWGARTLEVGVQAHAGDVHLQVQAPAFTPFASLGLVPPLALLAYRVARQRGATPDNPAWRQRYYEQGMTHIMGK